MTLHYHCIHNFPLDCLQLLLPHMLPVEELSVILRENRAIQGNFLWGDRGYLRPENERKRDLCVVSLVLLGP